MVEETFIDRLKIEHDELAARLDKLETFLTTKAHTVEATALGLLKIQAHSMRVYLHTLRLRLHLLDDTLPVTPIEGGSLHHG